MAIRQLLAVLTSAMCLTWYPFNGAAQGAPRGLTEPQCTGVVELGGHNFKLFHKQMTEPVRDQLNDWGIGGRPAVAIQPVIDIDDNVLQFIKSMAENPVRY